MKINILKPESTNRAIFLSMSFSMASKLLTFAQSVVISYSFGTQVSTDILFYGLSMFLLIMTVTDSINKQVMIPSAVNIRDTISDEDSKRFISFIYAVYLGTGIIGAILFLKFPAQSFGLFSKFGSDEILQNIDIIRFIAPAFLAMLVNTYILDMFSVYRYFTLPMLLEMLKSIIIIVFVILFRERFSVLSLAIGVLIANIIQFSVLNLLLFTLLKCRFSIKVYKLAPKIRKNIVYTVLGQGMAFVSGFIMMYLMSGFKEGVYSALDYGQRIASMIGTVVIGQVSTVVGMNIIELHAKKDFSGLSEEFSRYLKTSLFVLMPFCFIIALNSKPFISLLFERGSFNSESAGLTAGFFMFFILALPFNLIDSFIVRLIIAKQIQKISFLWQIFYNVLALSTVCAAIEVIGHYGYPAGELIATFVYVFIMSFFLLRHQFSYINRKEVLGFILKNLLLNACIGGGLYLLLERLDIVGTVAGNITNIAVGSVLYIAFYLAASITMGFNRDVLYMISGYSKRILNKKIQSGI